MCNTLEQPVAVHELHLATDTDSKMDLVAVHVALLTLPLAHDTGTRVSETGCARCKAKPDGSRQQATCQQDTLETTRGVLAEHFTVKLGEQQDNS